MILPWRPKDLGAPDTDPTELRYAEIRKLSEISAMTSRETIKLIKI